MKLALLALAAAPAAALDNGRSVTPPMGWRSWNLYGANVNQQASKTAAAAPRAERPPTPASPPTLTLPTPLSPLATRS